MTFLELQAEVRRYLRDEDALYVTLDDVQAWLNQAQRDLSNRLTVVQDEVTAGTVEAGNIITLPDRAINVLYLRIGEEMYQAVDDGMFFDIRDDKQGAMSYGFRIFNGVIEMAPLVDVGTAYELRYSTFPADMEDDEDVSPLPVELHEKLVWYAVAHAFLKEREKNLSETFFGMYYEGIPAHPNALLKRIPGPLRLRVEPSPWDREGRHLGAGG